MWKSKQLVSVHLEAPLRWPFGSTPCVRVSIWKHLGDGHLEAPLLDQVNPHKIVAYSSTPHHLRHGGGNNTASGCVQMAISEVLPNGHTELWCASKWPSPRCFQMDTRALKDSALSVSTFARQFARLRGFPQGATEFSGPEIHTAAGARACADHGRRPTKRGKRVLVFQTLTQCLKPLRRRR